jgi:hypothetical protein
MLVPFVLFLGAAISLAVLKSPPRVQPAHISAPERLTPANTRPLWNPAAPLGERYESVTVIDTQRATRIVEVMGTRREVLYMEAVK